MAYLFGPFRAARETYQLQHGDRTVALTPKLLDVLFHLLEHPATLVTKEELLDAVWPDANVTDNALAQAISELREALGDSASAPTYIKTVARRGYRFIAPVHTEATPTAPPTGSSTSLATGPDAPRALNTPPEGMPYAGRTIAVLDFDNVTREDDVAWLAAGIPETVSNDLTALGSLRVIDRWRVLQAARVTGGGLHATAAALGASLVVTGSYQRVGTRLRITARIVDVEEGDAVADAKVDGALADVFLLQDEIVAAFAREIGLRRQGRQRPAGRETSHLSAYRAHTEGWLALETLDTSVIPAATAQFEQAIEIDPQYAAAYTGLANAKFITYEMTRLALAPDFEALELGLAHARKAVELDDALAEAHATLSFLLVSAMSHEEARTAARRAVALEPDNWRHQYRLGHASWGTARVRALERALVLFPQFPYATLELTMVQVARGELDRAERTARAGGIEQDRHATLGYRYPAIGFHWLLGVLETGAGRLDGAIRCFNRELALTDRTRLYGPEYAAAALAWRGAAELTLGHADAALASFRESRTWMPGYVRAALGEGAAAHRQGRADDAARAWAEVDRVCVMFRQTRRAHDALHAEAARAAILGDAPEAVAKLTALLDSTPPSHIGWTLPLEVPFLPLRGTPGFDAVLARLADRAV